MLRFPVLLQVLPAENLHIDDAPKLWILHGMPAILEICEGDKAESFKYLRTEALATHGELYARYEPTSTEYPGSFDRAMEVIDDEGELKESMS